MNKHMHANIVFSKFTRDFNELKNYLPIRPSEMGLLNIITRGKGDHTPLALAERMAVSKPMIAAHISSLEEKGYIVKEQSPEDKRSFFVRPTEKAQRLCHEYESIQTERIRQLELALGESELESLVTLLDKAQKIIREIRIADSKKD